MLPSQNLLANPIIVTGVMSQSYKQQVAASVSKFQTLKIQRVIFENPTSAGDTLQITDPTTGFVLARLVCGVAGNTVEIDWRARPRLWSDFIVSTLSSGAVIIELA